MMYVSIYDLRGALSEAEEPILLVPHQQRHKFLLRSRVDEELIEYMTSMITDEDPLRGLLFY